MKTKIISCISILLAGISLSLGAPIPCAADYDGDGLVDPAIYHPDQGYWEAAFSTKGYQKVMRYGLTNAVPVVGDFDGDGWADFACFRPSTGEWAISSSAELYSYVFFYFGGE